MPDMPNTESMFVASLAIAWEIVLKTHVTSNLLESGDKGLTELTNAVIKAQQAIYNSKLIE